MRHRLNNEQLIWLCSCIGERRALNSWSGAATNDNACFTCQSLPVCTPQCRAAPDPLLSLTSRTNPFICWTLTSNKWMTIVPVSIWIHHQIEIRTVSRPSAPQVGKLIAFEIKLLYETKRIYWFICYLSKFVFLVRLYTKLCRHVGQSPWDLEAREKAKTENRPWRHPQQRGMVWEHRWNPVLRSM